MQNILFQFGEFDTTTVKDGDVIWVDAIHAKTYHNTPYGDVVITPERLDNFAAGIKSNVRGIELATDYDHGRDSSKGSKASGYIRDAKVEGNSLKVAIEPTPVALSELRDKEWRYFSLDWEDSWAGQDGKTHKDVVMGGAFTNRPIAKGLMPINFSEVMGLDTTPMQFAEWTTQYKDSLPDSCYMYVSGSTRKLPVKDANGKVDIPHVRDALSRLSNTDIPDTAKSGIKAKLQAMLGAHQMSEAMLVVPELVDVLGDMDVDEFINDVLEEKEGDPGMTDEEKAALEAANATIVSLRTLFKVPEGGDLVALVSEEHKQFSELQSAANSLSSAKKFSEEYPEEFKRMQRQDDHIRSTEAKLFSEQLSSRRVVRKEGTGDDAKDVATGLGLSALALEMAESTHKKFSEGVATIEDFTGFVDTVLGGGIVDYGTKGSTQGGVDPSVEDGDVPTNVVSIRKKFSEVVDAVAARDTSKDLDYRACVAIAAKEKPLLFAAYSGQNPQVEEAV